jgi:hypothetical protein
MPRGRKSAESVEVNPMMPGAGRPEPPAALDPIEARIWRDVTDALPGHWIDLAGQLVLRRLVCQAAIAERKEQRIRRLSRDVSDAVDEQLDALAVSHSATAKTIAYLLAQLRATPRSRMVPRDARFEPSRREPESRPWEIRAGGGDIIQ